MRLFVGLGLLFLTLGVNAQEEKKADNHDLRSTKPLFMVENLVRHEKMQLEQGTSGDFMLVDESEKNSSKQKLARGKAQDLDGQFSALFVKLQFEMPNDPSDCKQEWRLMLRGDEYQFCAKNDQKDQAIKTFVADLKRSMGP